MNCNECLYRPDFKIVNHEFEYRPCKMIDHKTIRLYTKLFGGYDDSIYSCPICYHYKPAKWDTSSRQEWNGIDAYIEYLEKDVNRQYVTLCVGGYDCYGEYQFKVSLLDWLRGDAVKENKIKYKSKYKVLRTPGGKPTKTEFIDSNGIEDISKII